MLPRDDVDTNDDVISHTEDVDASDDVISSEDVNPNNDVLPRDDVDPNDNVTSREDVDPNDDVISRDDINPNNLVTPPNSYISSMSTPPPTKDLYSSNIRGSRDIRKQNTLHSFPKMRKIDSSSSSLVSKRLYIGTPQEEKKETIILTRLEKMENSIIIINSSTGSTDLDKLTRVSTASGENPKKKDVMSSKVSRKLNPGNVPESVSIADDDNCHDTDKPEIPEPPVLSSVSNDQGEKNDAETFVVPATSSLAFTASTWHDLYSERITNKQNGSVRLPTNWRGVFAEALEKAFPYCCINFKRHKLYKVDSKLFKCWYYCTIEGCKLNGTALLDASFSLVLQNACTNLHHVKRKPNSFKARNVSGEDRKVLAETDADMAFPSKVYHRRLAALDETSFKMGNLKNVPQSKDVITQSKYENRKNSRVDDSIIVSLKELKNTYVKELNSKVIPGFIQFTSFDPLTVALWCEKDIELFHRMIKKHSLLIDATGTIATKLNGKEIFYFAFISFDRSLKVEPVPHIELLTDRASFNTRIHPVHFFRG